MTDWQEKLFIQRADLFIKIMNQRWSWTERFVNGITDRLKEHGIERGNVLDLCCGNGRIAINMAKKGFNVTGIDYSKPCIDDAKRRANEENVGDKTSFIEGDVRDLIHHLSSRTEKFDVVVSAWTSIGYNTVDDDRSVFGQARQLSHDGSVFFIIDTVHEGRALLEGSSSSFTEIDDLVMLEKKSYEPISSRLDNKWTFYKRRDKDLVFVDELDYRIRVYGLPELSDMLCKAGWCVDACYGSIISKTPFGPSTGMNLIASSMKW